MKKFFGGMDITYAKNFRQMTDWLAQGKFAICMGCKDSARAKKQGLPVDDFDTNRLERRFELLRWRRLRELHESGAASRTPPRFSSTGFCRAKVRSRCKSSVMSTIRRTHGASIFRKTTFRRTTGCSRE